MGFFGAIGQGKAEKNALTGEAQIAKVNAKVAEDSAQSALLAGARQQQQTMIATSNMKATQRVGYAANGIDASGGGTPVNVAASTEVMGEIDRNTEAANAVRAAWGYRTQETNDKNSARSLAAQAAGINPATMGLTSLLNSAGSVASNYYNMKKAGAFNSTPAGVNIAWNPAPAQSTVTY